MESQLTALENNPLLKTEGLPDFDKIEASHVGPAMDVLLPALEDKVQELEREECFSWETILRPLELLDERLSRAVGPIVHLMGVKNSQALRQEWNAVQSRVVAFGLRIQQSMPLYRALKAMEGGSLWQSLDEAQRRIISRRIQQAELAGIGLEGKEKERFNDIQSTLAKLGTDFSNNVLDETKNFELIIEDPKDVEGLPTSALQLLSQSYTVASEKPSSVEKGPWRVTLDLPSYLPMMQHCENRDIRKQLFYAYNGRASKGERDNGPIILETLALRKEAASLLGYESHAEVSTVQKMAGTVDAVDALQEELRQAAFQPAAEELKEVQALAQEPIEHWDLAFYSERLREKLFSFTDEELRPYFQLPKVLEGLFSLTERLFSVRVARAKSRVPIWHPDVEYYVVEDSELGQIASFYLDPYSRPEDKRGGAWMGSCLGKMKGQLPVAHIICNGTPPVGDKPSLLSFREVETLFHEFGHGLQHMLTEVEYADAAGINGVEWDAVEIASQFMENWCYHKPTLLGMTAHVETGEALPEAFFEKIKAAKNFQAANLMLRQLRFGMVDMELHHRFDTKGEQSPFDVMEAVTRKTSHLPPFQDDRFLCAFSHIFSGGYAAGYYSYKWAEVLSADAFSLFEEKGLTDDTALGEAGILLRKTLLALGGGKHPMEIFEAFRGRKPTVDALLRHRGLAS